MTTLVLVLSSHTWPYPTLIRTIKRTWASVQVAGIDTLFYSGGPAFKIKGRDLDLPVPDDLPHVGHKTIACFEYLLASRDFDLIFRTNCSSYVDLPNLHEFVQNHGRTRRFYCGKIATHGSVTFASGSGYFLSRDLVEFAVERKSEWNHSQLDDVALGNLMRRNGVQVLPAPRKDYLNVRDVKDVDTSQFHFRCKTESRFRIDDLGIMIKLHREFCRARGEASRSPYLLMLGLARRALAALRQARFARFGVARRL